MLGKTEGKRRRERQRMRWLGSISGHEFEQTLGGNGRQRSLAWCSPWGCKELEMIEQLNHHKGRHGSQR